MGDANERALVLALAGKRRALGHLVSPIASSSSASSSPHLPPSSFLVARVVVAAARIQRRWRQYQARRLASVDAALRALSTCSVCCDESALVVRCSLGHTTCGVCALSMQDTRCPLCREHRAVRPDATVARLLVQTRTRLRCGGCYRLVPADRCESHRIWCDAHAFACPAPGCTRSLRAHEMAAHVREAHVASRLVRDADGCYHATLLLARNSDTVLLVVGDVVLALQYAQVRRQLYLEGGALPVVARHEQSLFHISLRGYYPSPRALLLRACFQQLQAGGVVTDEFRCAAVPPVLATRESVAHRVPMPAMTPRSTAASHGWVDDGDLVTQLHPGRDAARLQRRLAQAEVRDVPPGLPLLEEADDDRLEAVVLHIRFSQDGDARVGEVFDR